MMDDVVLRTATSTSTSIRMRNLQADEQENWSRIKLAIYMTTHLPPEHVVYLPCWKDAIQRLEIFEHADLILYTTKTPSEEQLTQLPFRKVTIKVYDNPGYQEGAVQAMIDPFLKNANWFDDYDWVIRLNMDVLIRHDTWLIRTMLDPTMNGIFRDCINPPNFGLEAYFHTDFYAFRPSAVDRELLLRVPRDNAEGHLSLGLRNIFDSKQFAYITDAANSKRGFCRIVGVNATAIHSHNMWQVCPYYYNYTEDGVYIT
jgi:hypothetical protein